ncbi:MAG: hypothetical protein ABIY70_11970 [Capsulimonas sp.]|uniref:hypothetical protein n=1 Tax=Capsulimonas sp. TaxID=2494211 RepID=UPI003266E6A5
MSIAEQFNHRFSDRGGRYEAGYTDDPNGILARAREIMQQVIADLPITTTTQIYADLVASAKVSAVASSADGNAYIGMHIGTVLVLYDLFLRMMATDRVLPEIGNVAVENHEQIFGGKLYATYFDLPQYLEGSWPSPVSEHRKEAAATLTLMAVENGVYHEFGHIALGHLTKQINGTVLSYVEEEGGVTRLPPMIAQMLEWQADCWAVRETVKAITYNRGVRPSPSMRQSPKDQLFYRLFSLYCFLSVVAQTTLLPEDFESVWHPTPGMRQLYLIKPLYEAIEEFLSDEDTDEIKQVCMQVFPNAENAVATVTTTAVRTEHLEHLSQSAVYDHINRLEEIARSAISNGDTDTSALDEA